MPCYHPITAYRSRQGRNKATGRWPLTFNISEGYVDMPVQVPCGNCIGCRLEYARQWAIRCLHESKCHKENCFITLTYNDDNLPLDNSVHKRDLQLFMKRLRKRFGEGIKYYACGEYGGQTQRPHYHLCVFGLDFKDKIYFKGKGEFKLYTSEILNELWPYGYSLIGSVTFDSACYVARYITKKYKGPDSDLHYKSLGVEPEFVLMSRRPGIGREFAEKYKEDILTSDFVIIKGKKVKPPKYYDNLFDVTDKDVLESNKRARKKKALEFNSDLAVKEQLTINKLSRKSRSLEKEY